MIVKIVLLRNTISKPNEIQCFCGHWMHVSVTEHQSSNFKGTRVFRFPSRTNEKKRKCIDLNFSKRNYLPIDDKTFLGLRFGRYSVQCIQIIGKREKLICMCTLFYFIQFPLFGSFLSPVNCICNNTTGISKHCILHIHTTHFPYTFSYIFSLFFLALCFVVLYRTRLL